MEKNDQSSKKVDFNNNMKYLLNEPGTILY